MNLKLTIMPNQTSTMKKNKKKIKCISVDCDNPMFSSGKDYEGVMKTFNDYCIIVSDDIGHKRTISLSLKRFIIGHKLNDNKEFEPQYCHFQIVE